MGIPNDEHTALQGMVDLAQKIKDGLDAREQQDAVHVCLQYPGRIDEERTL